MFVTLERTLELNPGAGAAGATGWKLTSDRGAWNLFGITGAIWKRTVLVMPSPMGVVTRLPDSGVLCETGQPSTRRSILQGVRCRVNTRREVSA